MLIIKTDYDLRTLVLECLSKEAGVKNDEFFLNQLAPRLAEVFQKHAVKNSDGGEAIIDHFGQKSLAPGWEERAKAILWDLANEGLLRPIIDINGTPSFNRCQITQFGLKALSDPSNPHDPDGSIARLKQKIPNIDSVIVEYLAESMRTLGQHCLLSSTITLGCASEQAMLLLIEKTAASLKPTDKSRFESKFQKLYSIKQKNEEYRKWFDATISSRLKTDKGSDWITSMEKALNFLFDYFRTIRNDAGHPTGKKVGQEEALGNITLFSPYLRQIYDLMSWLDANKPI